VKTKLGICRLESGERTGSTTEVKQTTAADRDRLVVAGTGAEKVTELVLASAEALGRAEALNPRIHRVRPLVPR
jgi:hypothetical protein